VVNGEGKVTEGFADTLQRFVTKRTGYLHVHDTTGERRGRVFLEYGDVVAVLVDGYQPRLARRLTASGFVSDAGMLEVLSVVEDEYDPRIAVECVTRGLVAASTVEALNREFMLSAAMAVDEWDLGDSRWVGGVAPWEGRSTPVSVPLLVIAMARRREHWAHIWTGRSTATLPDRVPVRTSLAEYEPENADEAAILRAVDGQRTLDQVAGECGFTRFQAGHVLAGLMTKKVLDLCPDASRPVPDPRPVGAGYFAPSQPLPTRETTQGTTQETHVSTPGTNPEPKPEVATGPVAADHPEGNVMITQNEAEEAGGLDEHQPAESDPAAPTNATESNLGDFFVTLPNPSSEPITPEPSAPEPTAPEPTAPEPNLGDFFVTLPNPAHGPDHYPPVEPARHSLDLPPLPSIGGGASDFYAVPPTAHSSAADVEPWPAAQPVAQFEVEVPPAAATAQEFDLDAEVTQLRRDLLFLAAQRNRGVEQVSLLRAQAVAQSSEAEAAGIRAEEADEAMATGQRQLDEASAAHASLVRELQSLIAREKETAEAWEVAKAEAVASDAGARQAEATLTGCEEQMDKARERLIELAL